jgi:predicted Ser/Thr protein kinase
VTGCAKPDSNPQNFSDPGKEACERASNQAKEDIKSLGHALVIVNGLGGTMDPYIEELELVAREKGLKVKTELASCIDPYYTHCYQAYMDKMLSKEFGEDYIENLHKEAQNRFTAQRFDREYHYWETTKRAEVICGKEYCHSDFIDSLNTLLGDNMPYTYCGNMVGHSHILVNFRIDSLGNRTDYTLAELEFIFKEDKATIKEIANLLKKHLSMYRSPWEPAILYGYKVCVKGEPEGVAIRWK